MTLTWAPPFRPYSAVYALICTFTSAIASMFGGAAEFRPAAAAVTAVDAVDVDGLAACRALYARHGRGEAAAERFVVVREQRTPGRIFNSDIGSRPRIDRFSTCLTSSTA